MALQIVLNNFQFGPVQCSSFFVLKYFLFRALAAILASRASFLFCGYIAIKFSFFFLISNIFY